MNWKTISETCPKAWKEFVKRFDDEQAEMGGLPKVPVCEIVGDEFLVIDDSGVDSSTFHSRDLYDHFDALDIRLTIQCKAYGYGGYYRTKESNGRTDGELHETRTEAESAAFHRAFQLREQITTT